jgi:peptide-methionine (R)-S-oxide reductase
MDIEERKTKLSDEEKHVLFEGGTEVPFTGELLNEYRKGQFTCKVCGTPLFNSDAKFDSGSGWPSFDQAVPGAVEYAEDTSLGMLRTEVRCATCHAHLGHVFSDGPESTGKRYCMNSICMEFKEGE